ncbi:MAG TPA: metalloregulator ArsR/SmtB family transcription factor [Burkholderiaceae bacterium]|nr:metalloregulator ArsR/SmtB family transcription factor [Burkholderiaceae bacterium]
MVNHSARLDRVFGALVSPARRAILARLAQKDSASISELAQPIAMTLPAVMKHLDVLEEARLITRAKTGRTMLVRLSPKPMAEAAEWLSHYEKFWSSSLDRLAVYAEKREAQARKTSRRNRR